MKKIFICFVLISALRALADVQNYPLSVAVMTSRWEGSGAVKHGTGKADVQEGKKVTAYDFTYDCAVPFLAFGLRKPYPAAWKEKGSILTLSVTKVQEPDKKAECDLHMTQVSGFYAEKDGRLVNVSKDQFEQYQEQIEKDEKAEMARSKDKYPLRVVLLDAKWTDAGGKRKGTGKGNVRDGQSKRGFEFSGECPAGVLQNLASNEYWGQWARKESILLISAPPVGDAESPFCPLDVTMLPYAWKRDASGKFVPGRKISK